MTCIDCFANIGTKIFSDSRLQATVSQYHGLSVQTSSVSKITTKEGIFRNISASVAGTSRIVAKENVNFGVNRDLKDSAVGSIAFQTRMNLSVNNRLLSTSRFTNKTTDKFVGHKLDFKSYEKLFPIEEPVVTLKNYNTSITLGKTGGIERPTIEYINEGVFDGSYTENDNAGRLISDDQSSIIFTNNTFTSGDIICKFTVNKPFIVAKKSYFAIRAKSPFDKYTERKPQSYKIYDIKLEDPQSNLIIKYNDINIKGDNNYSTYISTPSVNNLLLPTWNPSYPNMDLNGNYTLQMTFSYVCEKSPFTSKFQEGFEESCVSSYNNTNDPLNYLLISAIEVGNSGTVGPLKDQYLNFYSQVTNISNRVTRTLLPTQILTTDFNNGIYPEASSVWKTVIDDLDYTNITQSQSNILLNRIRNDRFGEYITLIDSKPVQSSGRLILKFDTSPEHSATDRYIGGAFIFGQNSLNKANLVNYLDNDEFFDIDSIELKVIAKKHSSSSNYAIDVVGYSDDKLLHVTSPIGGFLQNSGALTYDTALVPNISGFKNINFGLSETSFSDQSSYFNNDISRLGDHYIVNDSIQINSTSFQEYTIPLNIYQDPNKLGFTRYSLSSFFENLYLDISPIPSGASICSIKMVLKYKPSNAIMMHTLGSPNDKSAFRKKIRLFPSSNGTIDGTTLPSGLVAYKNPHNLFSNYSRRWRGNLGYIIVGGSFDKMGFDFSFNHKQSNTPFLSHYIDFTKFNTNKVYDHNSAETAILYSGGIQSNENISNCLLSNFGWRYSSEQLFDGQTTPYKSISLDNNSKDSFDKALKLLGKNRYLNIPIGSDILNNGFALFFRFSADLRNNISGQKLIFGLQNNASNIPSIYLFINPSEFIIGTNYESFNIPLSNITFPASVLILFNHDNTNKLKIYINDTIAYSNLIGTYDGYFEADHDIIFGNYISPSWDVPIFLHEFGISKNTCNIVSFLPDRSKNTITIDEFFDSYKIKNSYIDDNISSWHLGAFKICEFSPDFDFYTKRVGRDYLTFSLNHNGSGYLQYIDKELPSNINLSGVAYHTQIENDFLRFDLSSVPYVDKDRFYSVSTRICKTLPRGYKFNEEAICVDTIIEHDTYSDIKWPNGKLGPKLIVSLYTKSKEVTERPSQVFGLINRDTHYLEPSGCIRKLTSKFTFDSLFDNSESWSSFNRESYLKEFDEKYFSKDIDDMFLQYDLVYPSGKPIDSLIKLHSANVRLDDAIFTSALSSGNLKLSVSGEQRPREYMNLFAPENGPILFSGINLYASGIGPIGSGLNLYTDSSGILVTPQNLNLYVLTIGSASSLNNNFGDIFGSSPILGMGLYASGQFRDDTYLPLYVSPMVFSDSGNLNLITLAPKANEGTLIDTINFLTMGISTSYNAFPSSIMPIYITGTGDPLSINNSAILYVNGYEPNIFYGSGSLNLSILNYPISTALANASASIFWNNKNTGENITVSDNSYAYVDSDDNIRGVDLICYGLCPSLNSCVETVVNVHGINWYDPEICVDGGIFRAKNTYTNLTFPSGSFKHSSGDNTSFRIIAENNDPILSENEQYFNTEQISFTTVYDPIPYSGHFYGIRKFSGLAPNLPYSINITGKTGSLIPIDIPTELTEVEYNKNETDVISSDYSGFRITADTNYREIGSQFGKAIASKDDLFAVGSPFKDVTYQNQTLQDAGTVFLYRRSARPSGTYWPLDNYKSPWVLEEALTLPSGVIRDYSIAQEVQFRDLPFTPIQTTWFVGQEGRQFGHSVDISINKKKKSLGSNQQEIVVVGGPSAKWSRTFNDTPPSGVNIGLMIFTDEFKPTVPNPTLIDLFGVSTYADILKAINNKDLLFNFFANPRIKFDVKIIICQPIADSPDIIPGQFPDKPEFITLKSISRNIGKGYNKEKTDTIVSGIQSAFLEAFPDTNNLPPLLGVYVDNSNSLGRESLEPAIDEFFKFYQNYTFANGLKDAYGVPCSGEIVEYIPIGYDSENWIEMSKLILSEVLDTGNLIATDRVRLLTKNIGTFDTSLSTFNVPPESGGRVYIFEKESGSWNLIQEIKSPNITYEHPDRFGHAVSISDNGEVIAIGSPYINQALSIYEKNEDEKLYYYYSLPYWVETQRPDKYAFELNKYKERQTIESAEVLYLSLDKEDKFRSRLDLGIQEYRQIYTFNYSSVQPNGSWSFIPETFAPTSRLGYSVDVNEDGSVVVAGAPTDSLNIYNDADVYYNYNSTIRNKLYRVGYIAPPGSPDSILNGTIDSSWSSVVNAGSIHVFESHSYYPHDKVVEYGRFGNLHENISDNTPDSGHFNYLSQIFNDKEFVKTEFTDSNIPQDAGLAFIITPQVDSLSDEVFENIVNWLALGDRNLVLVGNDPKWEGDGRYYESNEILNRLLSRLNSRMRIVQARTQYESLSNGYTSYNNIIPSFVPQGSTETYTKRIPIRGSGVADIKIYYPGYEKYMPCSKVSLCGSEEKIQLQSKCELPLKHYGDLRAQWVESCCSEQGKPIIYGYNWPLVFGSYTPECKDTEFPDRSLTQNLEPIPLLVAAEQVTQKINYPEVITYNNIPIYETITENQLYYEFGSPQGDNLTFIWDSGNNQDNNLTFNVTNNLISKELFYKPEDGGLLQARAVPKIDIKPYIEKEMVSDKSYFAIEYPYLNTTSRVILISSTMTESVDNTYSGAGDQNVKFYINLVSASETTKSNSDIAQLGGWTTRTSFIDGYENSILRSIFKNNNNNVDENVTVLTNTYNVAWVANIISQPSDLDLENIVNWLNLGNKKLIITCGSFESLQHAKQLCSTLGVQTGPVKLDYLNEYPTTTITTYRNSPKLLINADHRVGGKFFYPRTNIIDVFAFSVDFTFYPLIKPSNAIGLAYVNIPVYDDIPKNIENQNWDMNAGIVKLKVPVIANSGYRIFVTTEALTSSEIAPLNINIGNATSIPQLPSKNMTATFSIPELNQKGEYETSIGISGDAIGLTIETSSTTSINIQTIDGADNIDIYISSAVQRIASNPTFLPKTIRLIGISGVPIPIYEKYSSSSRDIVIGYNKIPNISPAYTEIVDVVRPISTDNTQYCTNKCLSLGNQLIEDGPVVAAQELEVISSFNAGVARSRITVLTDSSMIQGQFMINEDGTIPRGTYEFIRSLYPPTIFPYNINGRNFDQHTKFISPERGSPSKYLLSEQFSGIRSNFGSYTSSVSQPMNVNESKYNPKYVNRPKLPWVEEKLEKASEIEEIRLQLINSFINRQQNAGCTPRFSGIIDGTLYTDANVAGGLPQLLKDKGYDYLDFDQFPSGYMGDLFGYSVCIRNNKIIVGSPYSAFGTETITPWSGGSSLLLGNNGGAGSVYMFEKSGDYPWSCTKKFRPQSLMGQLSGINSYSDQFGHSVSMESDTIIIGSPNHKYSVSGEIIFNSGAFARKNFNPQFDIPQRTVYDLGYSGIRNQLNTSGINATNAGAIYVYENKITDWENKTQSWKLIEKIISNSPSPSGERFGKSIYLSRPYRSDADYTIFAGTNTASGNNQLNIGAIYTKDIMLRHQMPSVKNSGAWLNAKVFGKTDYDILPINLSFINSGDNLAFTSSGIVVANNNGDIFLEVSGQDTSTKGFIAHRPYIESIIGYYQYGRPIEAGMVLYSDGKNLPPSSELPLFMEAEKSAYVYNILGLHQGGVSGIAESSGLYLFNQSESGVTIFSSGLTLTTSGTWNINNSLKLNIRGK